MTGCLTTYIYAIRKSAARSQKNPRLGLRPQNAA
jgi:hypothetical protein